MNHIYIIHNPINGLFWYSTHHCDSPVTNNVWWP